jgi:peptide/nickel transport system permease protein
MKFNFQLKKIISNWPYIILGIVTFILIFPGIFATHDPYSLDVINRLKPPTSEHFFGTDEGGRDIYSRVIHGARITIGSALLIVALAATIGTLIGAAAGWFGGRLDWYLMRAVDVFLAFPYLVLAMALAASIGRNMSSSILALILVWWPGYARMVRGQVLSIKNELHIKVSKTIGTNNRQMLLWHVIPHTRRAITTRATLDVGYVIIAITGLSFLGLGAQNPSPEWGLLIANAKTYVLFGWWYSVFPGLVLVFIVSLFVIIGDRLSKEKSR